MNTLLALDFGNTLVKAAQFSDRQMVKHLPNLSYNEAIAFANESPDIPVMSCSVGSGFVHFYNLIDNKDRLHILDYRTNIPVKNKYETPQSLGMDRLAAVVGAYDLFPGQDILVIDAGTCITYELLTGEGNYEGGSISPGINMRLKALNKYTNGLPLEVAVTKAPLTGRSTSNAIQGGVMNGVFFEAQGMTAKYREKYPTLSVVLTGGDARFFENRIKEPIFVVPELVLKGLFRIARFNGVVS